MEKITNLKYLQPGEAINFEYKGQKAILVRPEEDRLVAYVAICPHEQEGIEWIKSCINFYANVTCRSLMWVMERSINTVRCLNTLTSDAD